ncbi:MAG: hypothetical protein AAFP84_20735, partial [Actinomycetota bacterium]
FLSGEMNRRNSQRWSRNDEEALREISSQLSIAHFHVPWPERNHARSVCNTLLINPGFLLMTEEARNRLEFSGARRAEDPSYRHHPWRVDFTTYVAPGAGKVGKAPSRPLCDCGIPRDSKDECQFGQC